MAAIMSQVFSNRFPGLSIADIRQVMQNTEANLLPSPHHPDNLDHLRDHDGAESDSDVSVGQENEDENSSAPSRSPDSSVGRSKRASVDFSEETSNDSRFNRLSSPSAASDIPQILRPSPTRLHEEFIRNSQMYAEELMRQQMSIVAASQKINVFPKLAVAAASEKLGAFRPHLGVAAAAVTPTSPTINNEPLNFRGIHNHLNAISQITQNLNHDMYKHLTSPSLNTSTDSSQSPPIHHHNHHNNHHHHHLMNNNLNDQNLKFGIDNILKADFGRRITEPLKRKGTKKRKVSPVVVAAAVDLSRDEKCDEVSSQKSASPTPSLQAPSTTGATSPAPATTPTPSASGSTKESTPIMWPAWVYCTRYSDRPSSGKYF